MRVLIAAICSVVALMMISAPSVAEKSIHREQNMMMFGDTTRLGRPFSKDPCVIKWQGRYLMYYSVCPYDPKLKPEGAAEGWGIGIAESTDLINWKRVGEIVGEQECERNGIVNGRVIELDGTLHLFYNTYGNGKNDAICHATSKDGLSWARDKSNPILRASGDWNCGRAIDLDVLEHDGKLLMYFATRDPSMKVQMIVVAGADRRSDFNRAAWTQLLDAPVMKPELPWEKKCIEAPSLIKRGKNIYMFYGGGYNNDPQQIGCAISKDGIHFDRMFVDKPLLANGKPGGWNSSESGHPGVFVDDDGQTYMFFQANNDMGRTWFISWVRIGWDGDRPFVEGK